MNPNEGFKSQLKVGLDEGTPSFPFFARVPTSQPTGIRTDIPRARAISSPQLHTGHDSPAR